MGNYWKELGFACLMIPAPILISEKKIENGVRDVYINKVEICGVNTSKLKVLKEKEKIEC